MGTGGRARSAVGGALLGLVLGLAAGWPAAAQEPAQPGSLGGAVLEVCAEDNPIAALPEVLPGTCKSLDALVVLTALVCGQLPVPPAACADLTDGRAVDPAAVRAYQRTWVARALGLQNELQAEVALRDGLYPHTHNSNNARAYAPSVSIADPNQLHTIADQLRLGFNGIELDVHWVPHPSTLGGNAPVLCHGQVVDLGGFSLHVGCSVDRLLADGLAEVAGYLGSDDYDGRLLLVYLQNELDGDPAAHAAVAALLEEHLGPYVHRPADVTPGSCADLPIDATPRSLLATGRPVLLVGNCGPGAWSSWVYQRGERWDERSNAGGYPEPADCPAERDRRGYDGRFIRIWEDLTWLSALAADPAPISEADVVAMVRCGVNFLGLDRTGPADPRLAALVWSWAPDEPAAGGGACAGWGDDTRFRAVDCQAVAAPACRDAAGDWLVPVDRPVPWVEAFDVCTSLGARFDVPHSGWDNWRLTEAVRAAPGPGNTTDLRFNRVWLNVARTADGWMAHLASPDLLVTDDPPPDQPGGRSSGSGRLPATGTPSPAALAGTLLLLAAAGRALVPRDR